MKEYWFIDAKLSIASYMVGFETSKLTYAEFNKWSAYLQKKLSTQQRQTIVFFGKNYLDELKREDGGFLFDIGKGIISLAEGKSKHHLDEHILSYVDVDKLLALLEAPKGFENEEELTL